MSADGPPESRSALASVVGVAAVAAPLLHSASDVLEAWQGGFSTAQLAINYVAFLAMPWLLVGVLAVRVPGAGPAPVAGAVLYGSAFVYFAHTTLVALSQRIATYEVLWRELGSIYTVHGALMIAGGALFAVPLLRGGALPRPALVLFLAGLAVNLVVGLLPVPDLLQVAGSALRNLGLVGMGVAILADRRGAAA